MYRKLLCDKDAYITDRVIQGTRHSLANTGQASSIDLFKVYGINKSSSIDLNEISRGLIRFDLNPLRELTGSILNIRHSSFKCIMNLKDVNGGQTTPSNFSIVVHALSQSFDEGIGKDVVFFNDIDAVNFITASYNSQTGQATTWFLSGANAGGLLGSNNIDIITSGNLSDGQGVRTLAFSQSFGTGIEDLNIDITTLISATLSNQIPDYGFRIAFSGSQENDLKTRFVKRFASRHVSDQSFQPRLIVKYNDSILDNQKDFYFDVSGSLFLYNYDHDGPSNLVSGSNLANITGANSLLLHLITDKSGGLYTTTITASQHTIGSQAITGIYSASFAVPSNDASIKYRIPLSSSLTYTQIWASLDDTVGYFTGSDFKISPQPRGIASMTPRNLILNIINVKSIYKSTDRVRFRVFCQDIDDDIVAKKIPVERDSIILHRAYYSIRDFYTNEIAIPFETVLNATRLSTDGDGMYFDIFMSDLDIGRSYTVDILSKDGNIDQKYKNVGPKFRVEE